MRKILLPLLSMLCLVSCNLIEYHPYDCRITGDTNINAQQIKRIEYNCQGKDTIRFAVISDTQRWYDETQDLVDAINALGNIDFVVHCGDQTDFGLTKEFMWMRDIFGGFTMPYVCLIGNHDCLGSGPHAYRAIYGETNFTFTASFLHLVCLNTNALEYDYSVAIPDLGFIEADQDSLSKNATTTVVAMHAAPLTEQFNNNIAKPFEEGLHLYPQLAFCLCGHDHHNDILYPFNDSIPYYECGSAGNRDFLLFTFTRNGYKYEAHSL